MSRLEGGLFSRPRGKTGGVVFGAGRTREGKVVTSRLLVRPSNPNTTAQQAQRGAFAAGLQFVRDVGPDIYRPDFNRAIAQLPGFQSMQSLFLNNLTSAPAMQAWPDVNLGTLHFPDSFSADHDATADTVTFTYSTEAGENGHADDVAVAITANTNTVSGASDVEVLTDTTSARSDGSVVINVPGTWEDNLWCLLYFRGTDGEVSEGLLSIAASLLSTVS